MVYSADECIECHSNRSAVDTASVTIPASALQADPETLITVTTSTTKEIWLCEPLFTNENGTHYVPLKKSALSKTECAEGFTLEKGAWVIAYENDDTTTCSVLVNVSSDNDADSLEVSL